MSNLISRAEQALADRRFHQAGLLFDQAADESANGTDSVSLWSRAAEAYQECRMSREAVRCLQKAVRVSEKKDQIDLLLSCWRIYILAIAGLEYDCSFEWCGEMDGSHDDDHDLNQEGIEEYMKLAEGVLRQALGLEGVNRRSVLKQAKNFCRKRKKADGWGSGRCLKVIERVERD